MVPASPAVNTSLEAMTSSTSGPEVVTLFISLSFRLPVGLPFHLLFPFISIYVLTVFYFVVVDLSVATITTSVGSSHSRLTLSGQGAKALKRSFKDTP